MNKDQLTKLEADLWGAADNLRANSDLKSSEYATPVLGLIFLKFADNNYRRYEAEILAEYTKLKGTRREKKVPNGNYLWINLFATSLKTKGRAALVMANSASDARHSEADIRQTLIEQNLIYAMLTLRWPV